MIDLIDGAFERCGRLGLAAYEAILQHDDIHRNTEYSVSLDHKLNLLIAELALPIANGSRVLMARVNPAWKVLCNLPKCDIRKVRHVDRDGQFLAIFEQFDGIERQTDFAPSSASISIGSVMR